MSKGRQGKLIFEPRKRKNFTVSRPTHSAFSPSTFVFALLHVFCVSDVDIHLVSVCTPFEQAHGLLDAPLVRATGRRRVRCDVRDKPRKAFGLVGSQLERPHLSRSCASLSDKFRLHVDVELPRPSMAQCG